MTIFEHSAQLKEFLIDKDSIGFVPTMGNLHSGHLSLISKSALENKYTVVSIFVNPTQFSADEDFDSYPRTLDQDLAKITELNLENIIIYAPTSIDEVYNNDLATYKVAGPTAILEGKLRPTHFDGVTTVVYHLFKIVTPTKAYFGQKDYQQLVLINKLNTDYKFGIEIVGMPIIRSSCGLALSSRNGYLSTAQKKEALKLNKALKMIRDTYLESNDLDMVNALINEKLKDERFNYLELREAKTLKPIKKETKSLVVLGNFQLENTKLLDNIEFELR